MSNFSIEPFFDPVKQWQYYISNDVALRMPYDINDPLFLQKVSVLQAEQVKNMVSSSYSQIAAFRDETDTNFEANRQAVEKGMSVLDSRITQVGGMITNSLESGFAAMNYGFTDLSNKAEIANAYLLDINKGMELSNQYSQQLVQSTGQLNAGMSQLNASVSRLYSSVAQLSFGMSLANRNLVRINNNLIAINRTLSAGFSVLSTQLSAMSTQLDAILHELKIPETQRERRYHIQEGLKYLAQATKDNDDLYFEDALDEFNKAISIESKDFFSHYYIGYIYMYSKEHLDIDKAIEHLRRFIHYAKAAIDTTSSKSLWDDGCFNLSLCYFIKGRLSDALQTISMQTGGSVKTMLQQAKYLSLGNDTEKKKSLQLVTDILNRSPYAVMLIMQDKDMLMNPYLIDHINCMRDDVYSQVRAVYGKIKDLLGQQAMRLVGIDALFNKHLSQNTFLSAVAILGYLRQQEKNWKALKMVFVKGGAYWMGAQNENYRERNYNSRASEWERPVHCVTVNDFYIGETEVTQALWKAVMGTNPSTWKGDSLPIENISWNDCQTFIHKLNKMTGSNYRLPTEAEWEYAARGGRQGKGYEYAGSNTIGDVAWYSDNSNHQTHPVKTKAANELGIYDMCGNVAEWVQDRFSYYGNAQQSNYTSHVLRGGGWHSNSDYCRVSYRDTRDNDLAINRVGFRLCHPAS